MLSEKLATRATIKKRKPTFIRRHAIVQFSKLKKSNWRSPKGMGNKQRRGRKGQPIKPTCGFGSPKEVKGMNKNGLFEVIVNNVSDLEKIDVKANTVVIGSTVGGRKKLEILNVVKTKKFAVSNIKDVDKEISKLTKVKKTESKKKSVEKVEEKKSESKPETTKKEEAKK